MSFSPDTPELPCQQGILPADWWMSSGKYRQRKAADLCQDLCPMKEACLELARQHEHLSGDIMPGVWGGLTEKERKEAA